ncbi:transcriptional regulator, partial [Streptomyces rapamycinicus]|nr:transcriptional regulator [Streptomyces rhizosphaericus]
MGGRRLLDRAPRADATNYAHATQSPDAWTRVADAYSVVYWLAARHRWMHLAELAVMKQR